MKDRVEGSVVESERAVASILDLEGELVAVPWTVGQYGQDQGLVAAPGEVLRFELEIRHGFSFEVSFQVY